MSFFKSVLGLALRLIACILAGTLLMILVYMIPTAPIEEHVANSADLFEEEGSYPHFGLYVPTTEIAITSLRDNYTDAWMLLNAAYDGDSGVVDLAMSNYRHKMDGYDTTESLVQHYSTAKNSAAI